MIGIIACTAFKQNNDFGYFKCWCIFSGLKGFVLYILIRSHFVKSHEILFKAFLWFDTQRLYHMIYFFKGYFFLCNNLYCFSVWWNMHICWPGLYYMGYTISSYAIFYFCYISHRIGILTFSLNTCFEDVVSKMTCLQPNVLACWFLMQAAANLATYDA